MGKYIVDFKYVVSTSQTVEAEDEGEAYEKARRKVEDADPVDFSFVEELESRLNHIG